MGEPSSWVLRGPFRRRSGPASADWVIRSVRGTELAPLGARHPGAVSKTQATRRFVFIRGAC